MKGGHPERNRGTSPPPLTGNLLGTPISDWRSQALHLFQHDQSLAAASSGASQPSASTIVATGNTTIPKARDFLILRQRAILIARRIRRTNRPSPFNLPSRAGSPMLPIIAATSNTQSFRIGVAARIFLRPVPRDAPSRSEESLCAFVFFPSPSAPFPIPRGKRHFVSPGRR